MKSIYLTMALGAAFLTGCSSNKEAARTESKTEANTEAKTEPVPQAPAQFKAVFETSKGNFTIECYRDWAPLGTDRFYQLLQSKFFDEARFFRVVPNFVVQFGISGDPKSAALWKTRNLADDPVKQSNRRGTVTFATAGPGTRTTQLFINLADNTPLDGQGFSPFGKVIDGMSVVDHLYQGYGEAPDQGRIEAEGNEYLKAQFERLDFVKTARLAP